MLSLSKVYLNFWHWYNNTDTNLYKIKNGDRDRGESKVEIIEDEKSKAQSMYIEEIKVSTLKG